MEIVSEVRTFGGRQVRLKHRSSTLNCDMQLSVFLPPQAEHHAVPSVYFLSGLTCTDENFSTKAGASFGILATEISGNTVYSEKVEVPM